MNIEELKAMQSKIELQAKKEIYDDLPISVINFLKDSIVKHCLDEVKVRNTSKQSARVLNNWIEQGVLNVNESDKGKTNRFTREEAIWLELINELRGFGVSIEKLKKIREELFKQYLTDFSLFKFTIIRAILGNDQTLIVFSDGSIKLMSSKVYNSWMKLKMLQPHIHINFLSLLSEVFVKNSFDLDIQSKSLVEDNEGIKILYFLRTGDFEYMKFELVENDVRLIENSSQLLSNKEMMSAFVSKKYSKIEIFSNERKFIIQT